MNDARHSIASEGQPYPAPVRLPSLVRFLIAAFWLLVFWGSGFVYAFFPGRNSFLGLISRLVACVLTMAGFAFFLRVLDDNYAPSP